MYSTIGVKGSVLEKFRVMKEAGFEGVEPMGGMNRDEVLAAFKETGLQAASVCDHIHWEKPLSAPDEATRKIGLDGLLQSLQDAHAYGAGERAARARHRARRRELPAMLGPLHRGNQKGHSGGERSRRENLHRECRQQFHHDTRSRRWNISTRSTASGSAGISTSATWAAVGPAERWIQVLGKRIVRIHVKDFSAKPAAPGARGERPKLLDGDTNWPAVMKALDRAGYQGWAISEQPADQAADVETARDLAQRMDKIFAS